LSLFSPAGLVISLPAMEFSRFRPPGSFFGMDALAAAAVSPELRLGLDLIAGHAARHGTALRIVARPEIFTSGESLAWLNREIGTARDHLCISDGSTLRCLPGLRTHAFFYRAGTREGMASLRQLAGRAPELVAGIASQVNTDFAFTAGAARKRPPTTILLPDQTGPADGTQLLPLYLGGKSIADDTARILESPRMRLDHLADTKSLACIAVSGCGWEHAGIAAELARIILHAYMNPQTGILLLLPPADLAIAPAQALPARIGTLLAALSHAPTGLPRILPPNIGLAASPPGAAALHATCAARHLIIDPAFDAWQHHRGFYEGFEDIFLLAEPSIRHASPLLRKLIGRTPKRRPLRAATVL
jgi:hypothetical protein